MKYHNFLLSIILAVIGINCTSTIPANCSLEKFVPVFHAHPNKSISLRIIDSWSGKENVPSGNDDASSRQSVYAKIIRRAAVNWQTQLYSEVRKKLLEMGYVVSDSSKEILTIELKDFRAEIQHHFITQVGGGIAILSASFGQVDGNSTFEQTYRGHGSRSYRSTTTTWQVVVQAFNDALENGIITILSDKKLNVIISQNAS